MARTSLSLLAGSALVLSALAASAQESRPERPNRALFGGGTDDSTHVVTVNGSAATGYDTSATTAAAEVGVLRNPADSRGSMYTGYSGSLAYTARFERFAAGASLSSSVRQYPQLDVPATPSHAASSNVSFVLGKNTRVSAGVVGSYQETRGFSPFPLLGDPYAAQAAAPSPDYGTGRVKYLTYGVNTGITHQLSRNTSLTASYDRQASARRNGFEDLSRHSGAFRLSRSLGRYLGLRLGYGYTEARYGLTGEKYQNHNLDTGVDYSRDLSLTRRTRLGFTTGATALRQEEQTRYDVIGSARLSREIGRTWSADVSYQRSAGFVDAVFAPVFSDSVNTGIGGLITRRLSFRAGAGASRGTVGLAGTNSNGFGAWTGSAGVNTALTRNLALGVNYTLYHYNFEEGATAVTGLLPKTNRHSVSVSLNAWAAVFQRGKRANASR